MLLTRTIKNFPKTSIAIGAFITTTIATDTAMRSENFRENVSKYTPYEEVIIDNPSAKFTMNGPIWDTGEIKGTVGENNINLKIDKKILSFLDNRTLKGEGTNLEFNQNFNLAHNYTISGTWNNIPVDLEYEHPFLKTGIISGHYNGKPVRININKDLSNILRGHYEFNGTINDKSVDIDYKNFLFNGANIKGFFNGKDVKVQYSKLLNLLRDSRKVTAELNLNEEDTRDFLFLQTIIQMNDMHIKEGKARARTSGSTKAK